MIGPIPTNDGYHYAPPILLVRVRTDEKGAASRMIQSVGRRYVRAINARHRRSGTLWGGRYKSCLVDSERYLLTCLRCIVAI